MRIGPGRKESSGAPWWIAGTLLVALVTTAVWHFRVSASSSPARELAFKASRVDLVGRMQVALASASEAEKSAVLAVTDEDSQTFADQARAATAELDRERQDLAGLLAAGGTQREKDLLAQFSDAFGRLRRVDDEVLGLAVRNTNLKAYALAFGTAALALAEFDSALARVGEKHLEGQNPGAPMRLAAAARIGLLRVQTLLAPHIAEESDATMDLLEASMTKEATEVRQSLDALAALPGLKGDADLATAAAAFASYGELRTRILALSRENTNVRSLALSLNQKRTAMFLCLDALNALQQVILEEPIAGVTYGRPASPR
jgi:hypothetical protein